MPGEEEDEPRWRTFYLRINLQTILYLWWMLIGGVEHRSVQGYRFSRAERQMDSSSFDLYLGFKIHEEIMDQYLIPPLNLESGIPAFDRHGDILIGHTCSIYSIKLTR
jgi:hypothetical protein